jgi:hypothetical protein
MAFKPHPNGGGLVEDTAHVAETAYVGEHAVVSGNAMVYGNAKVCGERVLDNVKVYTLGDAQGSGALVCGAPLISRKRGIRRRTGLS